MSERKGYCFVCDNRNQDELELLVKEPINIYACRTHPKDPYLIQGED